MKSTKVGSLIFFCMVFWIMTTSWKEVNGTYNDDLVEMSTALFHKDYFQMITMDVSNKRIKVKYFAAMDPHNKKSVAQRFQHWRKGKKIIALSSGTYMSSCIAPLAKPIGICIDNGIVVNQYLEPKLGGLVLIHPFGEIESIKWDEQNYTIKYGDFQKSLSLKKSWDKSTFLQWAQVSESTVFQTHLLVHQNKMNTSECTTKECLLKASRRFLAVCKDTEGREFHQLIHLSKPYTLYEATSKVFQFLKEYKEMKEISMMVNLDTGCQDVFDFYHADGTKEQQIKGQFKVTDAVNLLVYYYE
jgi:hypothetical protein